MENNSLSDYMERFSDILAHLRTCLLSQSFIETTTPVARRSQVPIGNRPEADIEGGKFLRTMIGPALRSTLKCHNRVFEIGPCFRNDIPDKTHSPEFTMLDLYAACETYEFLLELALALIAPAIHGKVLYISVADVIREVSGVDLVVKPVEAAISPLALKLNCDPSERPDRIIDQFVEKVIEPKTAGRTTVLCDYPVGGSEPCARTKPGTIGIANRFEIFIDGLEVVHGYEDEVDIDIFSERAAVLDLFDDDHKRIADDIRLGAIPHISVGLGIGVERLCMAADGVRDIWCYRFASSF